MTTAIFPVGKTKEVKVTADPRSGRACHRTEDEAPIGLLLAPHLTHQILSPTLPKGKLKA